jgi:beta-N-acetylhexosaminidase
LSSSSNKAPLSVIFGCQGARLSEAERRFFSETNPLGFILFERNCETPEQVKALVGELRDTLGRADAPILIDQEGGRVSRLKPPHWPARPSAGAFAHLLGTDPDQACREVYENSRNIAQDLHALGITVNCAPVCDIPTAQTRDILGDRACGSSAEEVTGLARQACRGFMDGGVLPVLKHIPGYGRAEVDAHSELPVVAATRKELEESDFVVFRNLRDLPIAMSAHVVYSAYDDKRPATLSAAVVSEAIRGAIGFDGLLITDDINMGALSGSLAERARVSIEAGCDAVLHCSGELSEMVEVAAAVAPLSKASLERVDRMLASLAPLL